MAEMEQGAQAVESEVTGGESGASQDTSQPDSYKQLQQAVEDEIVNNDGSPLDQELREKPSKQPPKGQQQAQPQKDGEAEAGNASLDTPKEGFLANYFVKGDDGEVSFDTDGFATDMVGDSKKKEVTYGDRAYLPEDTAGGAQAAASDEDPEITQLRKEREFKKTLHSNAFMYRTELDKALQAGKSLQEADQIASAAVSKLLQDFTEERELQQRALQSKNAKSAAEQVHRDAEMKAKSEANISRAIAEVGGMEKWQALCSHGIDIVNWLFDLANPDFKGTQSETNKAIGQWFRNMSANEKSLQMFVRAMKAKVAHSALPYAFRQGMKANAKKGQQNRTTHSRPMGSRTWSRAPKEESGSQDSVDAWLNPTASREEVIDTV